MIYSKDLHWIGNTVISIILLVFLIALIYLQSEGKIKLKMELYEVFITLSKIQNQIYVSKIKYEISRKFFNDLCSDACIPTLKL